ncbi:WAT1-related protein At5g40240-like [Argentina anserina]|uniref:WAT1-related protein At5g40240-like n=1 Tax=Argentina anserina TaxID=57926 RepID=UPI0021766C92|nr:WAT1-related protein At5g40240-like [Potentilla anserina]
MTRRSCYRDVLPFTAMVTVESTNVGLNILFKSATSKGMGNYVFITHIMKTYPAELVLALLYNLFGTIISAPVCLLIAETNLSAWRLRPGVALAAIIYSVRIFSSALSTVVKTWSLNLKGPVYVSIFKPLSIVIAAASSVIFLGDDLFLGSVIGAVMISIGFYGVIWGKAKEESRDQDYGFNSLRGLHSGKAPLLETYKAESM